MQFVPCTEDYWEFVRQLRTDPRVAHRFRPATITQEQQRNYMATRWHLYFIVLVDSAPAGYIGCVDGSIRVCTHPDFQRQGLARFMIENMLKKFPDALAAVKLDNEASRNLFETCGFVPSYTVYTRPQTGD
jgi:GNAT superfamily N-acetyltransferase